MTHAFCLICYVVCERWLKETGCSAVLEQTDDGAAQKTKLKKRVFKKKKCKKTKTMFKIINQGGS